MVETSVTVLLKRRKMNTRAASSPSTRSIHFWVQLRCSFVLIPLGSEILGKFIYMETGVLLVSQR